MSKKERKHRDNETSRVRTWTPTYYKQPDTLGKPTTDEKTDNQLTPTKPTLDKLRK